MTGVIQRQLFSVVAVILFIPSYLSAQDLGAWKQEKWLKANGSFSAGANLYAVNGIEARRVPFSWFTAGNITLQSKGVSLPFSFQFSEQARTFRQPFNQFGLSPTYKKFQAHLGYRSLAWSRYTLNNHMFLGAAAEYQPGRWRFGAMYGRFLKAIEEGDSNQQVFNRVSQFPYAAFDRWGYAFKLGYGGPKRHAELVYFKAKDNPSSLLQQPEIQPVSPGENAALGLKVHLGFLKHFYIDADGAISAVTRDTRADSLETGEALAQYTRFILTPRLSTAAYYAGDMAAGFRRKTLGAELKFTRIMPDYRSFGMYYIQTDVQRITFSPSWYSRKGTVMINGSIGEEHDNLASRKLAETKRSIGSAMLALRPSNRFGASFQYANFGTSQRPGLRSISDTVRLDQVTESVLISPYLNLGGEKRSSTLSYMYSNQTLNDRNKVNANNFSMTVVNHALSWAMGNAAANLNLDFSVFVTESDQPQGQTTARGLSAGIGKQLLDKKLNSHFNGTFSTNTYNGNSDGSTIQIRWNNQMRFNRHHGISANFTLTANQSKSNAVARSFQEYLATLMYQYNF
jgi:hypothetical protein